MIRTEAKTAGGDNATLTAYHEVIRDGETAIVAEGWADAEGHEVTRYEVRLPFSLLVHLALNTTEAERAEIDARADWRGVPAPSVPAPGDMAAALLAAPLDGTPETPEERAAFEAVEADIRAGRRGAGPAEIEARLREMRAAEPCDECGGRRVIACRANRDGDCSWKGCPQTRDGEPKKSWRPCPRDAWAGRDEDEDVTLPPCPKCAAPWTPIIGARVVTAARLTGGYPSHTGKHRRASALGQAYFEHAQGGWWVRHEDGAEAPYDTDELSPAPPE